MNLVTAHDYAWIRTSPIFRHMMESGYSLTLIQGRSPQEVLRAMEAEPRGIGEGTAGLIEANDAYRAEVDYDYWDESYVAGAFKAPGEDGDWTVVLGFDGGLGMPCAETLSEGGRVVAHSSNGGKPIHPLSASHGPAGGEGTVFYSDKTSLQFSLNSPDWFGGDGDDKAISTTYQNRQGNQTYNGSAYVYYVGVPLQSGKTRVSVRLPDVSATALSDTPTLHVFAMTRG